MKKTRILLICLSPLLLLAVAANLCAERFIADEALQTNIIGIGSAFIGLTAIGGTILAYLYARRLNRNPFGWAVGAMMMPYVLPLVLAFQKPLESLAENKELSAFLIDKRFCPQCSRVFMPSEIKTDQSNCETCGGHLFRFYPGESNMQCSRCGFMFSNAPVHSDDKLGEVVARKGLRCLACGISLCISCAPDNPESELPYTCSCGGELALRV